jgi:hypothetical protein
MDAVARFKNRKRNLAGDSVVAVPPAVPAPVVMVPAPVAPLALPLECLALVPEEQSLQIGVTAQPMFDSTHWKRKEWTSGTVWVRYDINGKRILNRAGPYDPMTRRESASNARVGRMSAILREHKLGTSAAVRDIVRTCWRISRFARSAFSQSKLKQAISNGKTPQKTLESNITSLQVAVGALNNGVFSSLPHFTPNEYVAIASSPLGDFSKIADQHSCSERQVCPISFCHSRSNSWAVSPDPKQKKRKTE